MFSNLASFIFGSSAEEPCPVASVTESNIHEQSKPVQEEEWEVIGQAAGVLTLGSLNEVAPRPSAGSTGSSVPLSDPSSDSEDVPDPVSNGEPETRRGLGSRRSARRIAVPFGSIEGTPPVPEIRAARRAQALKNKEASKKLSGKTLNRLNKAVMHRSAKATVGSTTALRASGRVQNLKQC